MTDTPDEVQRSVERLTARLDDDEEHWSLDPREDWRVDVPVFDLRLLLSERAELLATVERMRGALEAAQSFIADGGLAETDPGASVYRQVTAALTTGEEK